jgi:elongation factor G
MKGMKALPLGLLAKASLIEGMGTDRGFSTLKARVPLAEMYKYSTTLSSLTSGSATFTMQFADYQPVPGDVQDKLLKAYMENESEE